MHILRAPGGCPWDAEQTHESLAKHLIEEAYEVVDAIRSGDRDELVDELGDLLLQPVFHSEIASESGSFSLDDVATAICEKLIRRHPHVFSDASVDDSEAVLTQWDQIKSEERQESAGSKPFLDKANEGLPALMASQKLQKKAAKVGFDWPDVAPVLSKIREEIEEVEEAVAKGDKTDIGEEVGDLLFAVVNLARKTGHEAELVLHSANQKFVSRFQSVEELIVASGRSLNEVKLKDMDEAWEKVKRQEKVEKGENGEKKSEGLSS